MSEFTPEDALSVQDALASVDAYDIRFIDGRACIAHDHEGVFAIEDILDRLRDALQAGLTVIVSEGGAR